MASSGVSSHIIIATNAYSHYIDFNGILGQYFCLHDSLQAFILHRDRGEQLDPGKLHQPSDAMVLGLYCSSLLVKSAELPKFPFYRDKVVLSLLPAANVLLLTEGGKGASVRAADGLGRNGGRHFLQ